MSKKERYIACNWAYIHMVMATTEAERQQFAKDFHHHLTILVLP